MLQQPRHDSSVSFDTDGFTIKAHRSWQQLTPPLPRTQHVVEETDELVTASLAAMRKNLAASPAWAGAPIPTDDFLLMFLRSEVFVPGSAADRYRKFWKVLFRNCSTLL